MNDSNEIITLRPDLRFTLQGHESSAVYVVEDPIRQKFYRIAVQEYLFLAILDKSCLTEETLKKTNQAFKGAAYTMEHAQAIVNWLRSNQLMLDPENSSLGTHLQRKESEEKQKKVGRVNLISIKIPLFNPHLLINRISPYFKWFTSKPFFICWLCIILFSGIIFVSKFDEFFHQSSSVFSPMNMVLLWFAWILLKILHEFAHALVVYRYHGEVNEAGILFILFIPLTYINATSSWAFPNRLQRINAAGAGMYFELFIAALAVLVWSNDPQSLLGMFAHNIILVAGISSILFNANPLMRFDGYFILTDIVAIPNLYSRGKEFITNCFRKIFYGHWKYVPHYRGNKEIVVKIYGLLSWGWRILIMLSLISIAAKMFHGVGLIIAAISLFFWLGLPLFKFCKQLPDLKEKEPRAFSRFIIVCLSLVFLTAVSFKIVHWLENVTAPVVVKYEDQFTVKVKEGGFVSIIHQKSGSEIRVGDLLLTLDNPELKNELASKRLNVEQLELERRVALNQQNTSKYQVLNNQYLALTEELENLEYKVNALIIQSPIDGLLIATNLENIVGQFLNQGQEVGWIVNENSKILQATVAQNHINAFRGKEGQDIEINMGSSGHGTFTGKINRISPKASRQIYEEAFSAMYGGSVDVRPNLNKNINDGSADYEYFLPRFNVDIELPVEVADKLLAGQTGHLGTKGSQVDLWYVFSKYFVARYIDN